MSTATPRAKQCGTIIVIDQTCVAKLLEPSSWTNTPILDIGSGKWQEGMRWAELIVTAVNERDSLLKALHLARPFVEFAERQAFGGSTEALAAINAALEGK